MAGIDLNSDVGESYGRWQLGDDSAIFDCVSSASVACGFHAGDPKTMRITCENASQKGVVIGAHPSYRDRVGFGRRFLDVAPNELTDEIIVQIGSLQAIARSAGTSVRFVKPHGALYNAIVSHKDQADAVVRAILEVDDTLPLVVAPASVIGKVAAEAGLRTVVEAFADRAYTPEGTLLSRDRAGAVITDPLRVVENVLRVLDGEIVTVDGSRIATNAETICLHSDTAGAVELAARIRAALDAEGVQVRSFVSQ